MKILCSMAVLALLVAAAPAWATGASAGVLPTGAAAAPGAAGWEFAARPDAPDEELVTFLYLLTPATTAHVELSRPAPEVRALEIYANGTLSARIDGTGLVEDRRPDGFRPGGVTSVPLTRGLRPGLNRIGLLARFEAGVEDDPASRRPIWSGRVVFERGRLVELPLLFRGWERLYDLEANLYHALARFDQGVRAGHPPGPQLELLQELGHVDRLARSVACDRSVALVLEEADRFYMEAWHEPGDSGRYLSAQIGGAQEIVRGWSATLGFFVAHELYRGAVRRTTLHDALEDLALSKENLRNACAVLATRSGEAAPDALGSLGAMMGQDVVLTDAAEHAASQLATDLATRQRDVLRAFPAWRERFIEAYSVVLTNRKTVPPDYPSRAVVEHEGRVVVGYLDQVVALLRRDAVHSRILLELDAALLEPRASAPGLPRRNW